jgi:spore coat protein U-like protein
MEDALRGNERQAFRIVLFSRYRAPATLDGQPADRPQVRVSQRLGVSDRQQHRDRHRVQLDRNHFRPVCGLGPGDQLPQLRTSHRQQGRNRNGDADCTNSTPYTIALDGGTTGATDPTQRKMSKASERITCGVYRDSNRTQPWGSTQGTNTASGTGSGASQNFTAFGRVPVQTSPSPGNYADTVVTTITY